MKTDELNKKLFRACNALDTEEVRKLLGQGADPNCCMFGLMDNSLLSHVIYFGAGSEYRESKIRNLETKIVSVVRVLLEHGADPNRIFIGDDGKSIFTPLFYAVMYCGNPACAQLMLDSGAAVNLPHDDSSFPLYDMLEMEWDFCPETADEEKASDTAMRKKGAWFFQFSELLLEHSARTYDMLHPAYVWEKLSEHEQDFLSSCGELDLDSVKHFLRKEPELTGISDKAGKHYAFYAIDRASHARRNCFRGKRQEFELKVIEMLRLLVKHDQRPETCLREAAVCAVDKAYPLVLEWCLKKLRKIGKDLFQENCKVIFDDWNKYGRFVFPEEINSGILKTFPRRIVEEGTAKVKREIMPVQ